MSNYKVYVGVLQDVSCKYSMWSNETQRMLAYAEEPPKGEFFEVSEKNLAKLSAMEKAWFERCKQDTQAESVSQAEIECLKEFLTRFEKELKIEQEKANKAEN